ncbi:unnamed protein product [Schistosoma bovis]|nr:unnamed protein product [Schistosoma bovis]
MEAGLRLNNIEHKFGISSLFHSIVKNPNKTTIDSSNECNIDHQIHLQFNTNDIHDQLKIIPYCKKKVPILCSNTTKKCCSYGIHEPIEPWFPLDSLIEGITRKEIQNDPIETTTAMGITTEFNTTEQTTNTEDILAGLFILAILAAIVGCIVLRLKK